MSAVLRVIDAGTVDAVRSQALWHGIAAAMEPTGDPVLSFCRPSEAYVCIGYHRRMDELDLPACAELGLPVLRRQIGGGPVYLDSDQLFFQLTLPAGGAPAGVSRLYATLLEPAAMALRWLGISAEVAGTNDLVVHGRKVSGTGAGQIGGGVVVVGNVMFAFPHERMARALRLPDELMRSECLRLMQEHVAPLPGLNEISFKAALQRAYSSALGLTCLSDSLSPAEERSIARWQTRLTDPEWTAGPPLREPEGRQVKVRAGVWVYDGGDERLRVRTTVEHGRISAARIDAPDLNGAATGIARALLGVTANAEALRARLAQFGDEGARVLAALQPGLVVH